MVHDQEPFLAAGVKAGFVSVDAVKEQRAGHGNEFVYVVSPKDHGHALDIDSEDYVGIIHAAMLHLLPPCVYLSDP